MTQEGIFPTQERVPPSAIPQIVQVNMTARKRRLHALWGSCYVDLEVVGTMPWSALDCQPQTAEHKSMEPLRTNWRSPRQLRCTRCKTAGLDDGQEGILEVRNQAKQLFVMGGKDDNDYAGREAAARDKSTSRRSHGVCGGLCLKPGTRRSGAAQTHPTQGAVTTGGAEGLEARGRCGVDLGTIQETSGSISSRCGVAPGVTWGRLVSTRG